MASRMKIGNTRFSGDFQDEVEAHAFIAKVMQ